jgi:PEP-CTERM motif-containing protein
MRTQIMKAQVATGSATLALFAVLASAQANPITLSHLQFEFLFERTPSGVDPGFVSAITSPAPMPLETAPTPLSQFIATGSHAGTTVDPTSTYSMGSDEFGDFQTQAVANADVELDPALSLSGVGFNGAFYMTIEASSSYQLVVNKKPGRTVPSSVTNVPVSQVAAGSVRCSPDIAGPTASVGVVNAAAEVNVSIPGVPLNDDEIARCNTASPQASFSGPTGVTFPVGKPATITVSAAGIIQLVVGGGTSATEFGAFQASADPTFEIDPSFLYADDFEIDYSPGFSAPTGTPADVPEPSSLLVLGIGLLSLRILRWHTAA